MQDTIVLAVYDKESLGQDDLIGEVYLKPAILCNIEREIFSIYYNHGEKVAGLVRLSATLTHF